MLRTALGPRIAAWLEDAAVIEVMLNPDGRLWVDRLSDGLAETGEVPQAQDGEAGALPEFLAGEGDEAGDGDEEEQSHAGAAE